MEDQLRDILRRFGRLSINADMLGRDDDLFDAGLSSLATVNIMLAVEEAFDVEFPDHLLTRRSFQSISMLENVVTSLKLSALAS